MNDDTTDLPICDLLRARGLVMKRYKIRRILTENISPEWSPVPGKPNLYEIVVEAYSCSWAEYARLSNKQEIGDWRECSCDPDCLATYRLHFFAHPECVSGCYQAQGDTQSILCEKCKSYFPK